MIWVRMTSHSPAEGQPRELAGAGHIGGRNQRRVQHPDPLAGSQSAKAKTHGQVSHSHRGPSPDSLSKFVPIHVCSSLFGILKTVSLPIVSLFTDPVKGDYVKKSEKPPQYKPCGGKLEFA